MAFTSRWTVFEASSLRTTRSTPASCWSRNGSTAGEILAADGTVLARSLPGREGTYSRTYPTGSLFAHPLGYYFTEPRQRPASSSYRNDDLEGQTRSNLQIDPRPAPGHQTRRRQGHHDARPGGPAGRPAGARRTPRRGRGARPAYRRGQGDGLQPLLRPERPAPPGRARRASSRSSSGALVNRATQDGYAPGSTFKVVTATAAIDTGRYTPESTVSGRDGVLISGVPLSNDHHESFGQITLTEALVHSVNTVWAQVAVSLGKRVLGRYMRRFGFNREPELDYPATEMSVSGEYSTAGAVIAPTSPQVDVGRMGIGQDKLEVTAAADGRGRRRRRQRRAPDGPPPDRAGSSTPKGARCRRSPRGCSRW